MEKILLVINARRPDVNSIDFACQMAAFANSKLTGLFIENLFFEYIPAVNVDSPAYFEAVKQVNTGAVKADTDQAISLFKEDCQRHGVKSELYVDKGEPMQEVIYESRFADLLIIDPRISFFDVEEEMPSHFAKEILTHSECPVLLISKKFEEVEEIAFCYDGSASSVFAIKQFSYLFPAFSYKKALLLEINKSGNEEFNESHRRIMEWLKAHYHSVYYHALKGDVKDELFSYFFMKRKKMIVMGAYGRGLLSNFFKKSSADVLMRMVDLPLFIAHR